MVRVDTGADVNCMNEKTSMKFCQKYNFLYAPMRYRILETQLVVVGLLGVAHYGKLEVFSLIELSSVGLNMVNHFKHVYPWRWIWLYDSIFINVGVIIILGALNKVGLLGGSLLALAHFVEMSNFMAVFALGILGRTPLPWLMFMFFHISCPCPPSLGVF